MLTLFKLFYCFLNLPINILHYAKIVTRKNTHPNQQIRPYQSHFSYSIKEELINSTHIFQDIKNMLELKHTINFNLKTRPQTE